LYNFARAPDAEPQYPMQMQFLLDGEPALECLGFDLQVGEEGVQSTFYWRALRPLPPGLRLYPFYFDDDGGQILEDTGQRPLVATLWYPPERWPVGEVIQTATLPWDVGATFSLGLGVVQGEDWQAAAQRLPIRVESSELVVRLLAGDTWARLLHVAGGEPVKEYRVFQAPAPQYSVVADFAGQIRLLGYDLTRVTDHKSRLTLYWQAEQRMDTSYTVFAQLIGPAGVVRAQVDRLPREGGYPTVWWVPGEVVADELSLELPADAPLEVPYRLVVGLYDAETGQRLPVRGMGADFVELQTLQPPGKE
jgi:hypothetical protein